MGESSACLLRSFSQPSQTSQESPEGDPLRRALTSSVSFGRFVSESLVWEKWSSFNQNRYLEEAEKYSKPGSVAEKKAYFEAHYKKIAARKAAPLLEQQSAAVDNTAVVNMLNGDHDDFPPTEMEPAQEHEHAKIEEVLADDTIKTSIIFPVDVNQQTLPKERTIESTQSKEVELATEHPIFVENEVSIKTSIIFPVDANQQTLPKERTIESTQSKEVELATEHPIFVENEVSMNSHDNIEVKTHSEDACIIGDSASSEKKEAALSSGKLSKHDKKSKTQSFTKSKIPIYPTKDGYLGTSKKTENQYLERKRSTPKSLHMSINFISHAYDINKISSPASKKNVDSRLFKGVAQTSKESSNQRTSTRASVSGISKRLSAVPQLNKERTNALLDQSVSCSTSRDRIPKSPLVHISKSKLTPESKAQRPAASSSFSLRSEERASKHKEFFQKLELKMNMTEAKEEQHQLKHKGKIVNDNINMSWSISSKMEANASLPLGKKSAGIAMNKKSILSCSPKIERKQVSFEAYNNSSRPPWRLSTKTGGFRDAAVKNPWPPAYSAKSVTKKTMHENTSPNIQL